MRLLHKLGFRKTEGNPMGMNAILSEFNRSLTLIADKTLLIDNFTSRIRQIMHAESVFVFLFNENTGCYTPEGSLKPAAYHHQPVNFNAHGKLFNWLSVNEATLVLPKQSDVLHYLDQTEQVRLHHLKTELIYPLKVMNQISGAVFLGGRTDKLPYSSDNLVLLSLLFDQAAFAIEHAILYEQQKERVTKMYRADRLAVLGELAAGAAHEIRNPLTAIRSTIQYMARDVQDPVRSEMLVEVISEVDRINKILQGLLSFARPSEINTTLINLEEFLMQSLSLLGATLKNRQIETEFSFIAPDPMVMADREQLRQILLNVLMNSLDAMQNNDATKPRILTLKLENSVQKTNSQPMLILSVSDTGCGIPEENIEKIFHPFYTTKTEGTGLGLAICYGFIRRHNGEIEVKSKPNEGTTLIIRLPQSLTK